MVDVVLESLTSAASDRSVEIVERKGIGHPDTICDALAEEFSRGLCRFYLERFGRILHHNVDKALLRGGAARAEFGGGEVLEPIDIYLAGRAVTDVGGVTVPVEEIAVESTRSWLKAHLHALDPVRHVRLHCLVRPGSPDLRELFSRQGAVVPLANDTSFGVGFAPLTRLEHLTLALERTLDSPSFIAQHPAHGEDVKIMAVRHGRKVSLTVARAFVASGVASFAAYVEEKERLTRQIELLVGDDWEQREVHVNAADSGDAGGVYLTVTGTSAESGDDGEVGRGNRANGLITPFRPMSLEALAGKNSISHVGKLYNLAARTIAERAASELEGVRSAECYLVSRIGAPIDEPALAHVKVGTARDIGALEPAVREIVREELGRLILLWQEVVEGAVPLY